MRYVSSERAIAAAGAAFAFTEDEPRLSPDRPVGQARGLWLRVLLVIGLVVA
jgi:hypothetical protein